MEGLKFLIRNNKINEIKSYVLYSKYISNHEIKNNSFDLLLYTIKNASSLFTIKYILNVYQYLYKDLNYAIDSGESPLAVALSLNKFSLSDFLIEQNADINFRNCKGDNILAYLYKNSLLNSASLKYLLNHKIEINTIDSERNSFLTLIINDNNVNFSKILHSSYDIYNNDFILKLIYFSKFQNVINDKEFKKLFDIEREKLNKICITDKNIIDSCIKQNLNIIKLGFAKNINTDFFKRIDNAELLCKLYENKKKDVLKFLVDHGAFLNQIETSDRSIFLRIIYNKDLEMAKYLVSKGINVNNMVKNWSNICYPYIYFVSNDEFYKLLIKNGADLYIPDSEYNKVLKVVNSSHSVAEYLTKHNYYSNSHIGNEYHCTFYSACKNGNTRIVKHLLQSEVPYLNNGLVYACRNGNTEIVKLLIEKGADVNHVYKGFLEKLTPLAAACMNSHEKVVKILLENGASIKQISSDGEPLYDESYLMMARQCKNEKIIEYLIKYGADINEIDSKGKSLLMFACKYKYETIAYNILKKKQINVHGQDENGNNSLIYACQNGLTGIVKILLKHQIDINIQNNYGETALLLACKNGYPTIVKLLIHSQLHQLNPNLVDDLNKSPLIYALINQDKAIVNDLLSLDQTINSTTMINHTTLKNNKTLLMYICKYKYNSVELIENLIEHHADLNKQNSKGETAIHYACQYGNNEIVEYLIKKGANINALSNSGDSSLMYAIKGNKINIIRILLRNHVDQNIRNNEGETAMIYASKFGFDEIVNYLIEYGANVDDVANNGNTALIYACQNGYKECADLLMKNDCNINAKGHKGKTALINACERGKLDIVKLLISYHANINIRDSQGKTALIYARENNQQKIVKYLTGYMERIAREEEEEEEEDYDYDSEYDDYDEDYLYTTNKVSLKLNKIRKKKVKNMGKMYDNDNKSMRKIINIKYSDDFYIT